MKFVWKFLFQSFDSVHFIILLNIAHNTSYNVRFNFFVNKARHRYNIFSFVGKRCWTQIAFIFLLSTVFFTNYITNRVILITYLLGIIILFELPYEHFTILRVKVPCTLFVVMKFQITKTTNHYMAYSKETSKRTAVAYLPFCIYVYTFLASIGFLAYMFAPHFHRVWTRLIYIYIMNPKLGTCETPRNHIINEN